jgi:glutamine amidotransferase
VSARIAVIDYGMGNRRSAEKALAHVGAEVTITDDAAELRAADGLLLPGVGAFGAGMANLRERGLDELIRERVAAGVPVLGVCLGMQLAFESSTEHGGAEGLGLVPGRVERLDAGDLKLPHIGWNVVTFTRDSPLREGLPDRCAFYHVHSYAPRPADDAVVLGRAEYGQPFVAVVERGSFRGVQFHPEKSSTHGLRLLTDFVALCAQPVSVATPR